jgi:hypothetical protein
MSDRLGATRLQSTGHRISIILDNVPKWPRTRLRNRITATGPPLHEVQVIAGLAAVLCAFYDTALVPFRGPCPCPPRTEPLQNNDR